MSFDVIAGGIKDLFNAGSVFSNGIMSGINYRYMKDLQERQWQREDSAVQRRVADLKAAGLSPTLAAGSAASSSIQSLSAPQLEQLGNSQMLAAKLDIARADLQNEAMDTENQFQKERLRIFKEFGIDTEADWGSNIINVIAHILGFDKDGKGKGGNTSGSGEGDTTGDSFGYTGNPGRENAFTRELNRRIDNYDPKTALMRFLNDISSGTRMYNDYPLSDIEKSVIDYYPAVRGYFNRYKRPAVKYPYSNSNV